MHMFKTAGGSGARAGLLTLHCGEVPTPNFIVPTIRGAVPHLTPDNYPAVSLAGLFMEDFFDAAGPLTTAAKRDSLPLNAEGLFVVPRRPDGKRSTKSNSDQNIGLHTFQGLKMVPVQTLAHTVAAAIPDIAVVPHDAPLQSGGEKVGTNRVRKMQARSLQWFKLFEEARSEKSGKWPLLASITPELNSPAYLEEIGSRADGVYLLPSDSRLASGELSIPHTQGVRVCGIQADVFEVLALIEKGVDLFYTEIDQYTDAGKALTFRFDSGTPSFLIDLTDAQYETDVTQLNSGPFTRAYLHHLLNANEMTAQVALQRHNLQIITDFYADIRRSIDDGSFNEKADLFLKNYKRD